MFLIGTNDIVINMIIKSRVIISFCEGFIDIYHIELVFKVYSSLSNVQFYNKEYSSFNLSIFIPNPFINSNTHSSSS